MMKDAADSMRLFAEGKEVLCFFIHDCPTPKAATLMNTNVSPKDISNLAKQEVT